VFFNFSSGKDNQKFLYDNILWPGITLESKDQENTLACFGDNINLKFVFLPHLTDSNNSGLQ